jgi:hypothetical protein
MVKYITLLELLDKYLGIIEKKVLKIPLTGSIKKLADALDHSAFLNREDIPVHQELLVTPSDDSIDEELHDITKKILEIYARFINL